MQPEAAALTASSRKSCKRDPASFFLFGAGVEHAALAILLVDPHHHAVRVEPHALAFREAVLHPLRAHDPGVIGLLHGGADLLLVGRAAAAEGIGDQPDPVIAVA